jgi:hypothetical protein
VNLRAIFGWVFGHGGMKTATGNMCERKWFNLKAIVIFCAGIYTILWNMFAVFSTFAQRGDYYETTVIEIDEWNQTQELFYIVKAGFGVENCTSNSAIKQKDRFMHRNSTLIFLVTFLCIGQVSRSVTSFIDFVDEIQKPKKQIKLNKCCEKRTAICKHFENCWDDWKDKLPIIEYGIIRTILSSLITGIPSIFLASYDFSAACLKQTTGTLLPSSVVLPLYFIPILVFLALHFCFVLYLWREDWPKNRTFTLTRKWRISIGVILTIGIVILAPEYIVHFFSPNALPKSTAWSNAAPIIIHIFGSSCCQK